eukprot:jgi/Botrbrau1/17371/Bobra.0680s0004.1
MKLQTEFHHVLYLLCLPDLTGARSNLGFLLEAITRFRIWMLLMIFSYEEDKRHEVLSALAPLSSNNFARHLSVFNVHVALLSLILRMNDNVFTESCRRLSFRDSALKSAKRLWRFFYLVEQLAKIYFLTAIISSTLTPDISQSMDQNLSSILNL